jgi:hypothetical protein
MEDLPSLFGRCHCILRFPFGSFGACRGGLDPVGNSGLSLKLKKYHLFSETVDYLGHVIRPRRLGVAEKNTTALKTAPLPRTQTELISFLWLYNVCKRFVPQLSAIAAPECVALQGYAAPIGPPTAGGCRGLYRTPGPTTVPSGPRSTPN